MPSHEDKDANIVIPVVFVAAAIILNNPAAVSLAISVIANYITEFSIGRRRKGARLEVVVESRPGSEYRRLEYDGDIEGLKELPGVICSLVQEDE